MTDTADRDARLYLLRVAQHPSPHTHAYVAERGVLRASVDIRDGTVPPDVRQEIRQPDVSIADDIRYLDTGRTLLTPDHLAWPGFGVRSMEEADRPFALWVRGSASLAELLTHAVTITGARAATSYGTMVAAELASTVTGQDVTVVNGGGYGIDEAALRASVAHHGRAVVILPCGIDQAYPNANARLFDAVVAHGGLVISEYAPTTVPTRHRFAARARLLAAFSAVTVIVEAGRRSGALSAAQTASRYGRTVLGIPGPIHSALSVGVHDLIRTRTAQVITSIEDILGVIQSRHQR